MNPSIPILACLTLAVLMTQPARASRPSSKQLAQWGVYLAERDSARSQATPWKDSLAAALAGISDSAERAETVHLLFLTTYKHHVPLALVKINSKPNAGKAATAPALAAVWNTLAAECRSAGLHPLEMAQAVYQFTNSDWAPVSVTTGPGLDKVKTAKDYLLWGRAVIATGKKVLVAKVDPAYVWSRQASSYKVRERADLAKVGLNPPPVLF